MNDWSPAMSDHIRVSDADRDHVAGRLQEHFAEGRLTPAELDERLSAALSAKTYADLRSLMSDLPEPELPGPPMPPRAQPPGEWAGRPVYPYRRRTGLLPIVLFALVAATVFHATAFVAALVLPILLFLPFLAMVAVMLTQTRRRTRRQSRPGPGARWQRDGSPPPYDWRQR